MCSLCVRHSTNSTSSICVISPAPMGSVRICVFISYPSQYPSMGSSFVQRGDSPVVGVLFGFNSLTSKIPHGSKDLVRFRADPTIVRARPFVFRTFASHLCFRHVHLRCLRHSFVTACAPAARTRKSLDSVSSPLVVHRRTDHANRVLPLRLPCTTTTTGKWDKMCSLCVRHSTNSTSHMCHQPCADGECENMCVYKLPILMPLHGELFCPEGG